MTIREEMEAREHEILAPWASFADQSKGRARKEPQCDIRPVFQRDRDRILHSKPFRRLKDKTQVFLYPDGDHYRTRMTHTLEVSQNGLSDMPERGPCPGSARKASDITNSACAL